MCNNVKRNLQFERKRPKNKQNDFVSDNKCGE